jgi:16S rRNA (cytosine967-C5)-methyltransferase
MSRKPGGNARLAALTLLGSVLDRQVSLTEAESQVRLESPRDRAFARHLAFGVLRWLSALEWLAGQLLKRPLRRRDRDIERLVLLGLLQLWKDRGAAHAAINETAECARQIGKPWAVGVVNAVLRRYQREEDAWLERLGHCDQRYAHPEWLLAALRADWPDDWAAIVEANNQPAPLWLRVSRRYRPEDSLQALADAGYTLERHPVTGSAVKISPAAPVDELPGFARGHISVQDPAAQLAAELLDVKRPCRVLDACAAPGGKTSHILEQAPTCDLTALDLSAGRLDRVRENLQRCGLGEGGQVHLLAADAADPAAWWDGQAFERILLDAPCSATGVIRRHPDIKWLRSAGQVSEAAEKQAVLLERLWPLLSAGGMLLYATCSVLQQENRDQIRRFLDCRKDAELSAIPDGWGRETGYGRQILPGELDMDGFFYARLRKRS